jgi:hypothetical protein
MIPWIADAKNYGAISGEDLVITNDQENFLKIERSHKYFVAAPKGIGKTLFLKYKKQLYLTQHRKNDGGKIIDDIFFVPDDEIEYDDIAIIPKDQELDRGSKIRLDNEKIISLSRGLDNWVELWKTSLSLSIIKSLLYSYNPSYGKELKRSFDLSLKHFPPEMKTTFEIENINTPIANLNEILKLSEKNVLSLHNYQNYLDAVIQVVRSGVLIFIDNIDIVFEDYLNNLFQKNIWFDSQIGLVKAIRHINHNNTHIDMFSSIRMEAYQKLIASDSQAIQISGETLAITYTPLHLKMMFEKNIRSMDKSKLINPEYQKSNPLYSFLGLKDNKINGKEDAFCYILRHTLKRPRDLMIIGEALAGIDVEERDEENIKRIINNKSDFVADAFLIEMKPFTQIDNFNDIFNLLDRNIFRRDEAKEICGSYNKERCSKEHCRSCNNKHIFCELYRLGLLGIIRKSRECDKEEQIFLKLGEKNWDSIILPDSKYYLIHPILNHRIPNRYTKVLVGDGYPWRDLLVESS